MVEMQASAPHELRPGEASNLLAEVQGICTVGAVMGEDWWWGLPVSGSDCFVVLFHDFAKFFSYHLQPKNVIAILKIRHSNQFMESVLLHMLLVKTLSSLTKCTN